VIFLDLLLHSSSPVKKIECLKLLRFVLINFILRPNINSSESFPSLKDRSLASSIPLADRYGRTHLELLLFGFTKLDIAQSSENFTIVALERTENFKLSSEFAGLFS
jgi:hypothetical protein